MAIIYPLKFNKDGNGNVVGFQEYVQGDQLTQDLIAGLMGRNRIINGAMDIWQRGTNFNVATGSAYTADRFLTASLDSGSLSISRSSVPTNANAALGKFKNYLTATVTAGNTAGSTQFIRQRIEGVKTLSGGKSAISIVAWADANKPIGIEIGQVYDPSGAGVVNQAPVVINLTTVPTLYTFVVDLPLVTQGITANDHVQVTLWFSTGSSLTSRSGIGLQSGTFNVVGLQAEAGPSTTDFDFRPDALELMLCQRYYEKSFALDVAPVQNSGIFTGASAYIVNTAGAAVAGMPITFKVSKRASPALTFYNPAAANSRWRNRNLGTDGANGAAAYNEVGTGGFTAANVNQGSDAVVGNTYFIHWTADAEL